MQQRMDSGKPSLPVLMIKFASFKANLSMAKDDPWVLLSAFKYLYKV